jgi:hypothetical protein
MGRGDIAGAVSPAGFWSRRGSVKPVGLYIACLSAVALGFLCVLVYFQVNVRSLLPPGSFSWSGLVLLLAVGIFAERYTVKIGAAGEVSAGFLAVFLCAAILGPLASFSVAVATQIPLLRRQRLESILSFSSGLGIAAGGMAIFYWALLGQCGGSDATSPITVALVGLASGIFFQVLDFAVFLPVVWLRSGKGPVRVLREAFQPFIPFHFFFLAISLGLIYIYRLYATSDAGRSNLYSTLLIVLCLLPVLGLVYAFRAFAHQRGLAQHNARLALRNERMALQVAAAMVNAVDAKDNYTASHSAAVAQWATDIAETLSMSEHEVKVTQLASLMHDVGKIGIRDEVLGYPGKLDSKGWEQVKTHCQIGEGILNPIEGWSQLATVVLYHHERYDGTGYPMGVAGEKIPLISRIICVADSYSAMVSDRPYRARLPVSVAKSELAANKGTQFDPLVVDTFLTVLEQHDEYYQRGEQVDFLKQFQKVKFLRELPPEPEEDGIAASGTAA